MKSFWRLKSTAVPPSPPGTSLGLFRQEFNTRDLPSAPKVEPTVIPDASQREIFLTSNPPPAFKLLKYAFLYGNDAETRLLLAKFVLPVDAEKELATSEEVAPLPDDLLPIYSNFNLDPKDLLPLQKPSFIKQSPFEFHSTFNQDNSYIAVPRLSVTKLLTSAWCELRDFYQVYSGSPSLKKTTQMKLGSLYHEKLENLTHTSVDMAPFIAKVEEILQQNGFSEDSIAVINQGEQEAELGDIWLDKIIARLFSLLTRSEARELVVHGYLNLERAKYIDSVEEMRNTSFSDGKVLVSAIIDLVGLRNIYSEDDLDFFIEVNDYIDSHFENGVIGFDKFVPEVTEIVKKYSEELDMGISDVKTRSFNKIPQQETVLEAAKLQVSHYKTMMDILTREGVAYELFKSNAIRRNLDLDQPIGIKHALTFLVRNYELVYDDFEKLSQGIPIGVEDFDNFYKDSRNEPIVPGYSFKTLLYNEETMEELNNICLEKYGRDLEKMIPSLMMQRQWHIPMTLRYLSARIGSLFEMFNVIPRERLSIEYHNVRTGEPFSQRNFRFDPEKFSKQLESNCKFWNGTKQHADYTDDLNKCKYCDFKQRCPIPNQKETIGDESVGSVVLQFIDSK